jgi:hypothetical protein
MQSKPYEKLDSLIIKAIYENERNPMYKRDVAAEALRIAKATGRDDMRIIDGRLTALRKAGVIRYLKKPEAPEQKAGWYLVPTMG